MGPASCQRPFAHALARRLCCALLVLACLPSPGHAETDEKETRARLEQLDKDIKRISGEINAASTRRDKLQAQLRNAEVEQGKLAASITKTRADLDTAKAEVARLEAERATQEAARDAQQARIAAELRTAWRMGDQAHVKVLLNQEQPHTVARAMAYYRYFFAARQELLADYRQTLDEIRQLGERIDQTLAELAARETELQQQQQELGAAQARRQAALAELDANIKKDKSRLGGLRKDREKLDRLLREIRKAVAKLAPPQNFKAFKSAKGHMPWPLPGKASNRFGQSRNEGKMRWQGVTIPGKEGATVRAIHQGRVVYADWLGGSGLLLILDHGDGYMSLYAHNQSLLRDVGEWVGAGEPVSTVGTSGGLSAPALYFEVRHQGKPVDPAAWCGG